jgi:hypothetical protein
MKVLRTNSPEMVRKAVGMHLLAYNPTRSVMVEEARGRDMQPREPSFNGARHTIRAFEEIYLYEPRAITADFLLLLDFISQKRAGHRPDGDKPRAIERDPKPYRLLICHVGKPRGGFRAAR